MLQFIFTLVRENKRIKNRLVSVCWAWKLSLHHLKWHAKADMNAKKLLLLSKQSYIINSFWRLNKTHLKLINYCEKKVSGQSSLWRKEKWLRGHFIIKIQVKKVFFFTSSMSNAKKAFDRNKKKLRLFSMPLFVYLFWTFSSLAINHFRRK